MTPDRSSQQPRRRRGTDVVAVEELTAWNVLRRYVAVGGWIGQVVFVLYGIYAGLSFGAFGGLQFFTDMYLFDYVAPASKAIGIVFGMVVGLVCVWAICVVAASAVGALVYWIIYRSFPTPNK